VNGLAEAYGNRTRRPEVLGSHGFEDDEARSGQSGIVGSELFSSDTNPGSSGPIRGQIMPSGRIVVASAGPATSGDAGCWARREARTADRAARLLSPEQGGEDLARWGLLQLAIALSHAKSGREGHALNAWDMEAAAQEWADHRGLEPAR
jgi:hypothetical protein